MFSERGIFTKQMIKEYLADLSMHKNFIKMPKSTTLSIKRYHPLKAKIGEAINYHTAQWENVCGVVLKEELFDDWLSAYHDEFDHISSGKRFQSFYLKGYNVGFWFAPNLKEDFYTFCDLYYFKQFLDSLVDKLENEELLARRIFNSLEEAKSLDWHEVIKVPVYETEYAEVFTFGRKSEHAPVGKTLIDKKIYRLKECFWKLEDKQIHYWKYIRES